MSRPNLCIVSLTVKDGTTRYGGLTDLGRFCKVGQSQSRIMPMVTMPRWLAARFS